jgi:hypothetical protein
MKSFYYLPSQKEPRRGNTLSETPESAVWSTVPFNRQEELYKSNGTWYKKDNSVPDDVRPIPSPAADAAITGGEYVPDHCTSAIAVDCYPESGTPDTNGYLVAYDMACSHNNLDHFYSGAAYPRQITKVKLGATTTAQKIILYFN